jgi:hypothetical protein
MSYRPRTSSHGGGERGRRKVRHEKAKHKEQKQHFDSRYQFEESEKPSFEEVLDKTHERLRSLGSQIFAFSPFSQYFNDWLLNLKSVISEFEVNPSVNVDEEFVKNRTQFIGEVEHKLEERQLWEVARVESVNKLAEKKHLLEQMKNRYTDLIKKLSSRRQNEIQTSKDNLLKLEEELEEVKKVKTSIFNPFSKRDKERKRAEVTSRIDSVKSELEAVEQNFQMEQEKLEDRYKKEERAVTKQVQTLKKEVENLEVDLSMEDRRAACEKLKTALVKLSERMGSSHSSN